MKTKRITVTVGIVSVLMMCGHPGSAIPSETPLGEEPNLQPRIIQEQIVGKDFKLNDIIAHGERIFSTPFNIHDGMGDGPMNLGNPISPGDRPSLQGNPYSGNGTFLRVNGLDAQSCLECHSVLSSETIPATFAVGGTGSVATNVFSQPTFIDPSDAQSNGFAGYNGRFINPPFLFGSGGVELLAKEMTRNLQEIKEEAKRHPNRWFDLTTHGVSFGEIRWVSADGPEALTEIPNYYKSERTNCSPLTDPTEIAVTTARFLKVNRAREEIITAPSDGVRPPGFLKLDTSMVEGIDTDLVVRPFGRKGNNLTTRDFDCGAMMFHFGIQPVEVVGDDVDMDGDGVTNEVLSGEMSALAIFSTTLPPPCQEPLSAQARLGENLFRKIGCADCHRPVMKTKGRILTYSLPEVPSSPLANIYYEVDLSKMPVKFPAVPGAGLRVKLFSDLKRHDMGDDLEETFHGVDDPADNRMFITARLWGVADTAPYIHDGRATTLTEAIGWHGGEAQEASDNFFIWLSDDEQKAVLAFLRTLRTPGSGACGKKARAAP